MALVSSEHLIEISSHPESSSYTSKVYGVVELEVQVSELLDNLSVALSCLYDLSSLNIANRCKSLKAIEQRLARLTTTLESLRARVQRTFKDITLVDDLLTLPDSCDSIMGKSPRNLKRTQRSATSGRSEARDFNNTSTSTFQSDVTSRMRAGCSPVTHRQLLTLDPISMYCSSARYSRCQNDTSPYTGEYESGHLNGGGFRISRL